MTDEPTAYLITFNEQMLDRDAMKHFLTEKPYVDDWMLFMPGAFVVRLKGEKRSLYEDVRTRFPSLHFVIAPLKSDGSSGVAPKPVWDFILRRPVPAI